MPAIDPVAHVTSMHLMVDGTLGRHVNVRMFFEDQVWPVEADPDEMDLAIETLCMNARDAMLGAGELTIAVRNVRAERDYVRISVSNTGVGMRPEDRVPYLEPFFSPVSPATPSTLRLPQVYGFAEQHGGHVAIAGGARGGTTVAIVLPRSRAAATASGR